MFIHYHGMLKDNTVECFLIEGEQRIWCEGKHGDVSLLGTSICSTKDHLSLRHWKRGQGIQNG